MELRNCKEEEKKDFVTRFAENTAKPALDHWEEQLKNNSSQEHIIGDKVTLADIGLLNVYASLLTREDVKPLFADLIDDHPALKNFWEVRHEEMKDYFENRPKCPM